MTKYHRMFYLPQDKSPMVVSDVTNSSFEVIDRPQNLLPPNNQPRSQPVLTHQKSFLGNTTLDLNKMKKFYQRSDNDSSGPKKSKSYLKNKSLSYGTYLQKTCSHNKARPDFDRTADGFSDGILKGNLVKRSMEKTFSSNWTPAPARDHIGSVSYDPHAS
jgi:hypothetical protein